MEDMFTFYAREGFFGNNVKENFNQFSDKDTNDDSD